MQVENTDQVAEQQDDAAFEAGFNNVRGDESPAETLPQHKAEESAAEVSTEVQNVEQPKEAVAPKEAEEPMIAGFKESELKALLAKAQKVDELEAMIKGGQDKVYGKFGEVQRLINEMKASPAGQQVKITGDKLKRLSKEFPEMAEMLAEDLGELSLSPAQNNFDPTELKTEFARQLEENNRLNEQKLLTIKHPDWQTTAKSDDFVLWKGTLPKDVRDQLENSWDAAFISRAFTGFENWKSTRAKATKENKTKRLDAAVTPNGVPNNAPALLPDNAGLDAGFSRVRKK